MAKAATIAKKTEETPTITKGPTMSNVVTEVHPPAVDDYSNLLEEHAGAGFEDVRAQDLALPFWKLMQGLSPELKQTDPAYVRGAREGQWLDTVSREYFDEITFVPCKVVTHYIEWNKLKDGGGLVKNYGTDRSVLDRCHRAEDTGRDTTPEGTEVIATPTWFGVVIGGRRLGQTALNEKRQEIKLEDEIFSGWLRRAVITMPNTAQKVSRQWLTSAMALRSTRKDGTQFCPPLFAMSYMLRSAPTKNDIGSWSLPIVAAAGWTLSYRNGVEIFNEAKEYSAFVNSLKPEQIEGAGPKQRIDQVSTNQSDRSSERSYRRPDAVADVDDDIPF